MYAALADGQTRLRVPAHSQRTSLHIESAISVISAMTGAVFEETVDPDNDAVSVLMCDGAPAWLAAQG